MPGGGFATLGFGLLLFVPARSTAEVAVPLAALAPLPPRDGDCW